VNKNSKFQEKLEDLYERYNRREFVQPDPLQFLYNYKDIRDREIVGLTTSSLAYGNVKQILKSNSIALDRLTNSPYKFLMRTSDREIKKRFHDFKHRFTTGANFADLLIGTKDIIKQFGSLKNCFLTGLKKTHATIIPALELFVRHLSLKRRGTDTHLLPTPQKGSSCKRLNLFLRWMVRKDDVDPGGWNRVPQSKLIIPLDTHMYKISRALGLTKRKQPNLRTSLEITAAFAKISPEDPTKYDFCLTRFGIRDDLNLHELLKPFQISPFLP